MVNNLKNNKVISKSLSTQIFNMFAMLLLVFSILFTESINAAATLIELETVVYSDGSPTSAVISGGISIDNDATFTESKIIRLGDVLEVDFEIHPPPDHVGRDATIIVAILDQGVWTVLNGSDGKFYLWDREDPKVFRQATLTNPYKVGVAHQLEIKAENVGLDLDIHMGYSVDGILYWNEDPIELVTTDTSLLNQWTFERGDKGTLETYDQTLNAAISGHNNLRLEDFTVDQCARACTQEIGFQCRSFDYNRPGQWCDLSDNTANGIGLKNDYTGNPFDHYARITMPKDIVGNAHAQIVDQAGGKDGGNAARLSQGRMILEGGNRDTADWVQLPDHILTGQSGLSDATIELWATNMSVQKWSMMFYFGPDQGNYMHMEWTRGTDLNSDRIEWKVDGLVELGVSNSMSPYELGQEYHIVMTIDEGGGTDGATLVKWYRDGLLRGSAETTAKLSDFLGTNNMLGRSQYAHRTANAAYNEIRIYDGVLSAAEVAASFKVGPHQPQIAFLVAYPDGAEDVYLIDADGSNSVNLTQNSSVIDGDPAWSPDRSRIAFNSTLNGNGRAQIYVMNTDGSNRVNLSNDDSFWDEDPSWSPDGSKIAFTRTDTGGNADIWVMEANGSDQVRLTSQAPFDEEPSWSPDGSKILFASWRDGNAEIFVMNDDGSNEVRLTTNPGEDRGPSWSPDGSEIAFSSDRDGDEQIYVMDANGSNLIRLTNSHGIRPSWSPDGSKIAFQGNNNIYVMNADGSNQEKLTNGGRNRAPSWR